MIDGYSFVIGTTHWDSDDNKMYKVTKISYYGDNIVGHRLQIPTIYSISMHEILNYMNIKSTAHV